MKIWIINHYASDTFFDNGGRHYSIAKYLKKKGHQPIIFCCNAKHGVDQSYFNLKGLWKETKHPKIDVSYVFIKACTYLGNDIKRILNIIEFYFNIKKTAREYEKLYGKPDVIYASSVHPLALVAGIQIAKKWGIKCVCEVRDLWPESIVEYSNKSKYNLVILALYQLEKWIYRKAYRVVFTMEGGIKYIEEKKWQTQVDLRKIRYVNNGVEIEEYNYARDNYKIKDEDLENNDIFKVVYAGSIRKVNNLERIVECARSLKKTVPHIKILIWGDGNEKELLENRCKELGLDNIVFKGHVEKKFIPYILSKADVNLIHWNFTPLMRFGMSANKLFDYLAAGKPILSDVNSAYNLISDYKCGIVVKDDSVESICQGIFELANSTKEILDEYGYNAAETAKKYDYKELTNKIEEILLEAISK